MKRIQAALILSFSVSATAAESSYFCLEEESVAIYNQSVLPSNGTLKYQVTISEDKSTLTMQKNLYECNLHESTLYCHHNPKEVEKGPSVFSFSLNTNSNRFGGSEILYLNGVPSINTYTGVCYPLE